MPRQVRIQYPGAIYHVTSRGNRRQQIYVDDVDRHDFLKTLSEACQKTGGRFTPIAAIKLIRDSRVLGGGINPVLWGCGGSDGCLSIP